MKKIWTKIIGTGSCLPPFVVDNKTLCQYYPGKGEQWILDKTGIRERRFGFDFKQNQMREGYFDNDLAFKAAKMALEDSNTKPEELNLIVRITCTAEYLYFPDPACTLHHQLGASKNCAAYTIPTGCGGLVYAIKNVDGQIKGNSVVKALVVASNAPSSFMDVNNPILVEQNKINAAIFGDGASAVVLEGSFNNKSGILASYWGACHEHDPMFYPAGGSRNPTTVENVTDHWYKMDARTVFAYAPVHSKYAMEQLQKIHPFKLAEIDWFLFHQSNLRIIESLGKDLDIPMEKILVNVDRYGNTSAASIGILLDEGIRDGKIKKGDSVLMVGIGAGWQFGSILFRQ